jgi:hypothetical protein
MDFGDERQTTHQKGSHRASGVDQTGSAGVLSVSYCFGQPRQLTHDVVMRKWRLVEVIMDRAQLSI